jgi:hypothetical protein
LRQENQNTPLGEIYQGDATFLVRSQGQFQSVDDIRTVVVLTREGVLERVSSVSFVAAASPAARAAVLADVTALIDTDPVTARREVIELPYDTEVMWAPRRSPVPGDVGRVASVNVNTGGVPKPPVDGSRILAHTVEGDGHDNPDVHGGERAAVCLYAQEAVERVRGDGHTSFLARTGRISRSWGSTGHRCVTATGSRSATRAGRPA